MVTLSFELIFFSIKIKRIYISWLLTMCQVFYALSYVIHPAFLSPHVLSMKVFSVCCSTLPLVPKNSRISSQNMGGKCRFFCILLEGKKGVNYLTKLVKHIPFFKPYLLFLQNSSLLAIFFSHYLPLISNHLSYSWACSPIFFSSLDLFSEIPSVSLRLSKSKIPWLPIVPQACLCPGPSRLPTSISDRYYS